MSTNNPTFFPIANLTFDPELQLRTTANADTVARYAEVLETLDDLKKFPPVDIFFDGEHYRISDGYLRYAAARLMGHTCVWAVVHRGTLKEALWAGIAANSKHGLARTPADRRRAIELAIKNWPERSNRMIAEAVGCSEKTISRIREELVDSSEIARFEKRLGRDGKMHPARRHGVDDIPSNSFSGFNSKTPVIAPSVEKTNISSLPKGDRITLKHVSTTNPKALTDCLFAFFTNDFRDGLISELIDATVKTKGISAVRSLLLSLQCRLEKLDR